MNSQIEYLKERQQILEERLASVRRDQAKPHTADLEDQAQEQENDAVVDQIGIATRDELNSVRNALLRYERGDYGLCQKCGQQIEPERLQAIPEAELCLNCATSG